MSKLTAAYVAGLIDGEGSIGISRVTKPQNKKQIGHNARIRIAMTDKDIIFWLKDSFGGYATYLKRPYPWKDCYCWTIRESNTVKRFLDKIYPYLKVKKKQAEIMKQMIKTFEDSSYKLIDNYKPGRRGRFHREIKDEIFIKREELYQQLVLLNKKGKPLQPKRLSEVNPEMGMRQSEPIGKETMGGKSEEVFPPLMGSNKIDSMESKV
jgi:hypothetical protein